MLTRYDTFALSVFMFYPWPQLEIGSMRGVAAQSCTWYPILGAFYLVLVTWYSILCTWYILHVTLHLEIGSVRGVAAQSSSIKPPLGLSAVQCHCSTLHCTVVVHCTAVCHYKLLSTVQCHCSTSVVAQCVTTNCTRSNCCLVQIVKHATKYFRRVQVLLQQCGAPCWV